MQILKLWYKKKLKKKIIGVTLKKAVRVSVKIMDTN